MNLRAVLAAAATVSSLAACGISDPSNNRTTPISGTLQPGQPGSGISHSFTASKNGELSVTFTSVTPPPSTGFSLAVTLGQITSGSCGVSPAYTQSIIVNRSNQFYQINKGDYCIFVFDPPPGVITTATVYNGTISHP
jgi:hypothetical protein